MPTPIVSLSSPFNFYLLLLKRHSGYREAFWSQNFDVWWRIQSVSSATLFLSHPQALWRWFWCLTLHTQECLWLLFGCIIWTFATHPCKNIVFLSAHMLWFLTLDHYIAMQFPVAFYGISKPFYIPWSRYSTNPSGYTLQFCCSSSLTHQKVSSCFAGPWSHCGTDRKRWR